MSVLSIVTLKNEKQFKLVQKFGKKISCNSLILIYFQQFHIKSKLSEDNYYYGMKVSRKFSKSAPLRNKAKRRIRVLLRLFLKDNSLYKGSAIMVVPRKYFNNYPFDQALSDIKRCL